METERKIRIYGGYFETFMETLTEKRTGKSPIWLTPFANSENTGKRNRKSNKGGLLCRQTIINW